MPSQCIHTETEIIAWVETGVLKLENNPFVVSEALCEFQKGAINAALGYFKNSNIDLKVEYIGGEVKFIAKLK